MADNKNLWTCHDCRPRRSDAVMPYNNIAIRLRYDYNPTTTYRARLLPIRRKQKMNVNFSS